MCGIAGTLMLSAARPPEANLLERMLSLIHHRGPDESGLYQDESLGMGNVRLSIIDLATGQQPISNEDGTVWIVFNGEIFNYVELMAELKAKGHIFRSNCDTEVIVHLYEEMGHACLKELNGQFAFAIWDTRRSELFLARDRVGIRPLFYSQSMDSLVFASEIKAILAHPDVSAQLDPIALDQIFTFWSPLTPRTAFQSIFELPPGHYMVVGKKTPMAIHSYWQLAFPADSSLGGGRLEDAVEEFRDLFADAIRLRLRADVPVGAYLSGGLDSSSTVGSILANLRPDLHTFSIGFTDQDFDETAYQQQAAQFFATKHTSTTCGSTDIGRVFPKTIWHTETPILRTAPAPMLMLSNLVRKSGIKVVVTGEGADEILAGYNIFKEALIRQFWARQPESDIRPLLLRRLYPYLSGAQHAGNNVLRSFFGYRLTDVHDPLYSHRLRWRNTSRIKQFFSSDLRSEIGAYNPVDDLQERVGRSIYSWPLLARAQYLETTIFMSGYLLSSQGDRMTMGHSVEGRYPFLDHRLVEFAARLPARLKLRGTDEKYLLKRAMRGQLPEGIIDRPKRPYRAPIATCFLGQERFDYVEDLLSDATTRAIGIFAPRAVDKLVNKARGGFPLSETEGMALTGILSTHLVSRLFVEDFSQQLNQKHYQVKHLIRRGGLQPRLSK